MGDRTCARCLAYTVFRKLIFRLAGTYIMWLHCLCLLSFRDFSIFSSATIHSIDRSTWSTFWGNYFQFYSHAQTSEKPPNDLSSYFKSTREQHSCYDILGAVTYFNIYTSVVINKNSNSEKPATFLSWLFRVLQPATSQCPIAICRVFLR